MEPSIPNKSDVHQYQLVPLMPQSQDMVRKINEIQPKKQLGNRSLKRTDYFADLIQLESDKKLFAIGMSAFLRIIYNFLCYYNELNSFANLLRDGQFMQTLINACEMAGWHNGYLSSKFLRIVKFIMEDSSFLEQKSSESANKFANHTSYYHLIFTSLSSILDYFLQKFRKENIKIFTKSEANALFEIIKTAVSAMQTVKKAIETDVGAKSGGDDATKGNKDNDKKFYDVYSDKKCTPLQELTRWVMTTYVPQRFIEILVELLTRIEARVQGMEFDIKRRLVTELLTFLSEYLSVFPHKRFDTIQSFYKAESTQGIRVRASLLADILKKSFLSSKMARIIEYMNTEEAGSGYLKEDKQVLAYSYCYLGESKGSIFPAFIVITKTMLYLLKETLEKPSHLAGLESLSPYPPKCIHSIEIKELTDLFQYPDQSSIRLYKGSTSYLLDFISTFEKHQFIKEIRPSLISDGKKPEKLMKGIHEFKYAIGAPSYVFSCVLYESKDDNDRKTFTDVIMADSKVLLFVIGATMNVVRMNLSESAAK